MIDRDTAMGQIGMAQMITRAYEEMLVSNVSDGGRLAEASLEALQARPLMKHKETSETMVRGLGWVQALRDRRRPGPRDILEADRAAQDALGAGRSPGQGDPPPYLELGPTLGPILGNPQIRNTWTDISGLTSSGQDRDRLTQLWQDCIPCFDRPRIADIDIGGELKRVLKADLRARLEWLMRLKLWLDNVNPFDDLCALLDFLNFMCLPDLVLMLKAIKLLIQRESEQLRNMGVGDAIFDLASALLRPYIMNLDNLLHTLLTYLMAPMSCIVSSIVAQLAKVPKTDEIRSHLLKRQEDLSRGIDIRAASLSASEQKQALGMLAERLMESVAYARQRLLTVEETVREFLGGETDAMGSMLGGAEKLKNLLRLAAIITTLIGLAVRSRDAKLCGGGGVLTQDVIETYIGGLSTESPVRFEPARTPDGRLEGFVLSADPGMSGVSPDVAVAVSEERFASFSRCLGAQAASRAKDLNRWAMGGA